MYKLRLGSHAAQGENSIRIDEVMQVAKRSCFKELGNVFYEYMGCLDVNTSMKSLDFDTRSVIAKECISQVCEAIGIPTHDRNPKMETNVTKMLGTKPRLEHSGSYVNLTVTSTCLKLASRETGAIIVNHEMPNISFASGGDSSMLDYIAYVAKDEVFGRACFILECEAGFAQNVIGTIGQAFELRFMQFMQNRPGQPNISAMSPAVPDPEYYNDLPGKVPPENIGDINGGKFPNGHNASKERPIVGKTKEIPTLTLPISSEVSVNLIDFEAPTPPASGPITQEKQLESMFLGPHSPTFTTTLSATSSVVGTGLGLPNSPSQPKPPGNKDPFDMQPFTTELPKSLSGPEQRKQLESQNWFHGSISRFEAEKLVKNDGDFLVRESLTTVGQYVLTGLQNGSPKHLWLVDPNGVVRTKHQIFDNVIHLIRHHSDNLRPIISAESMVILRRPVPRE